jgi:RNA polymerase sigma-70 factor (ECF subfamily)
LSKHGDNDKLAIQGLIAAERTAFETVYRRHNGSMVRVASAILRNRASAEEIAQETWMAVLRKIGGFEGRSSLAGWIFTILTNKAKDPCETRRAQCVTGYLCKRR